MYIIMNDRGEYYSQAGNFADWVHNINNAQTYDDNDEAGIEAGMQRAFNHKVCEVLPYEH